MSATPTIGSAGNRLDLLIRQGGTFGPVTDTLTNPDATPVNLTGCTIVGQIRKRAADTTVVAVFDVQITDASAGVYTFGLSSTVTASIAAGLDSTKPESLYAWDIELHDTLGRVTPLHWGAVRVHPEVTRA